MTSGQGPIETASIGPPPAGCWAVVDDGPMVEERGLRVGTSLASSGGFLVGVFLSVFWNGITSFFVIAGVAGVWLNLFGWLPAWCPVPRSSGQPMGLGLSLFMCVFMVPFVAIGLAFAWGTLLSLAGREEVRLRGAQSEIWTGIGPLGLAKRFDAGAVTAVVIDSPVRRPFDEDEPTVSIRIDLGGG